AVHRARARGTSRAALATVLAPGASRRTTSMTRVACSICLVVAWAATARAQVACPAGEITLDSSLVRALGRGTSEDRLVSPRNTFVVPAGIAIDPASEAIVYAVEADHEPPVTLAMGTARGRARIVAPPPTGRGAITLRRLRGGYRLDVRLR